MSRCIRWVVLCGLLPLMGSCGLFPTGEAWKLAVDRQTEQLGYRNWIVIAEASFPAHSRAGVRQITAPVEVPDALDHVLLSLERTENLRPNIYLTRELRSVENDFAPGIDETRTRIHKALHGHEPTEIDQQSLITLLEDANRSFDILVIRTRTALPYASVFIELQPGYWDSSSESRLRERIQHERLQKLVRPMP